MYSFSFVLWLGCDSCSCMIEVDLVQLDLPGWTFALTKDDISRRATISTYWDSMLTELDREHRLIITWFFYPLVIMNCKDSVCQARECVWACFSYSLHNHFKVPCMAQKGCCVTRASQEQSCRVYASGRQDKTLDMQFQCICSWNLQLVVDQVHLNNFVCGDPSHGHSLAERFKNSGD